MAARIVATVLAAHDAVGIEHADLDVFDAGSVRFRTCRSLVHGVASLLSR